MRLIIPDDIKSMYDEPHRYYHTIDHIRHCISDLNKIKSRINDFSALYLALLFHDVIYDPTKSNNELRSADFARKYIMDQSRNNSLFKIPNEYLAEKVSQLIICTNNHIPSDKDNFKNDSEYMLDIDLSILGASEKTFDFYEENIRKEYSFVPEDIYKRERAKILSSFFERDSIYYTEYYSNNFGCMAADNLERSLDKLYA